MWIGIYFLLKKRNDIYTYGLGILLSYRDCLAMVDMIWGGTVGIKHRHLFLLFIDVEENSITMTKIHDTSCLKENSIVKESIGYGINFKWSLLMNLKYVQIIVNFEYSRLQMPCYVIIFVIVISLFSTVMTYLCLWIITESVVFVIVDAVEGYDQLVCILGIFKTFLSRIPSTRNHNTFYLFIFWFAFVTLCSGLYLGPYLNDSISCIYVSVCTYQSWYVFEQSVLVTCCMLCVNLFSRKLCS